MSDWGVNLCGLSGTDAAWEHRAVKKATKKVVSNRMGRCASINRSTSKAKSASNVKPGGCGIFVDGRRSSRICERGQYFHGLGR